MIEEPRADSSFVFKPGTAGLTYSKFTTICVLEIAHEPLEPMRLIEWPGKDYAVRTSSKMGILLRHMQYPPSLMDVIANTSQNELL